MGSFNSAFASARKAGKKEFTWNGKRYNTKLADGPAKTPSKGPIPPKKPNIRLGAPLPPEKKGKSIFSGVDSDSLAKKPKAGKSGATQGFGIGEAKNSAAFRAGNDRARKFQKGELLTGKGEGSFFERFKKGLK